ncbi:MAG: hypothetical protein N2258_00175 [Brevinematales bacterium]|nr:hypothetical protein [Brevinematales bacterium]
MKELFILFLIFYGCAKSTKPIEVKSIGSEDFSKLDKIEESLVDYRFSKDNKILSRAKIEVEDYLSNKILNKEFLSRVWALKTEIAFLENNTSEFEKGLKNIKEKIPQLYVLRSLGERDEEKKLAILLEGEKEFENNSRIKLEIGLIYFDKAEYSKSFVYLDEALSKLPYTYKKFYGEKRELALKLKDTSSQKKWLTIDRITVEETLNIINSETSLLKIYNFSKIDQKNLKFLIDEKIIPENISPNKEIEKKEVIYILFKLLEKNNYKDIANFYKKFPEKYREKSPIKDLSPSDFYYEAAIYFVQKEIIELPDGKNIFPTEKISGKTLHTIIEKIKKIK